MNFDSETKFTRKILKNWKIRFFYKIQKLRKKNKSTTKKLRKFTRLIQ